MYSCYEYINFNGADLFTAVNLPDKEGKYPTVIIRNPYVDAMQELSEKEIMEQLDAGRKSWTDNGYAVVTQHCRGRGKSNGDCIPYINEREDGLFLREWIRKQSFYNGELFLEGGSYLSSVHFTTAPFEDDIKGAVLRVQDCERYNCNYRNGFYKIGLHGGWHVGMHKKKTMPTKNYAPESFNMLPLSEFTKTVFGESVPDLEAILQHPDRNDEFWTTSRYGGAEAHDAIKNADIPILLETGFYDIYTGGVFDMWNGLSSETKAKCALIVSPYDHGGVQGGSPFEFPNGVINEAYPGYVRAWFDAVRGKCDFPFVQGKVTYYRLFENEWKCEDFVTPVKYKELILGEGEKTYVYNPFVPTYFKGGLSANFGGAQYQSAPNSKYDLLSFYTDEFDEDTFVKGKMQAKLTVKSDCEDTCFYVRVSIAKEDGDFGLRDDINSICNFKADYIPGEYIEMNFSFDEHAFLVKKGEKLRIDISSSAMPMYIRHTNNKGPFYEQTTAKVAHNTVVLDRSCLKIWYE